MTFPTPHLDKLNAALRNDKLPRGDKPRLEAAKNVYQRWVASLDTAIARDGPPTHILEEMVESLNDYVLYVNLDLVFDSPDDFLHRQKGQLKLDNSIIEEFLPRLVHPSLMPEIKNTELSVGPTTCFSAVYFESSLDVVAVGGGLRVRTKAQDFAISRRLYLKASHSPGFEHAV